MVVVVVVVVAAVGVGAVAVVVAVTVVAVPSYMACNLFTLHQNQFAYQPGKSTETALHHVVMHTEVALEHREAALGASDRTYLNLVEGCYTAWASEHNCRWVSFMLRSRKSQPNW
jgi:hypothetical protein